MKLRLTLLSLGSVLWTLSNLTLCLAQGTTAVPSPSPTPSPTLTGVGVLTQTVAASGIASASNPVQSFTATGTITYFSPSDSGTVQKVSGPATLRVLGSNQFRIDATLPNGTRSIAFNGNSGARLDTNGKLTQVPLHNTFSMGWSPFPYLPMAAALTDPTMTISYMGEATSGGQQLHQVRIIKSLPKAQDRMESSRSFRQPISLLTRKPT